MNHSYEYVIQIIVKPFAWSVSMFWKNSSRGKPCIYYIFISTLVDFLLKNFCLFPDLYSVWLRSQPWRPLLQLPRLLDSGRTQPRKADGQLSSWPAFRDSNHDDTRKKPWTVLWNFRWISEISSPESGRKDRHVHRHGRRVASLRLPAEKTATGLSDPGEGFVGEDSAGRERIHWQSQVVHGQGNPLPTGLFALRTARVWKE